MTMTDKPSAGELADRCERYAKIIEGIVVVADDWQEGDPERREPRETLLEAAAALRSPPVAGAEVGVPFRSQVFHAAERANKRFGQWMPQAWLEIFIGEMMVTPDD